MSQQPTREYRPRFTTAQYAVVTFMWLATLATTMGVIISLRTGPEHIRNSTATRGTLYIAFMYCASYLIHLACRSRSRHQARNSNTGASTN